MGQVKPNPPYNPLYWPCVLVLLYYPKVTMYNDKCYVAYWLNTIVATEWKWLIPRSSAVKAKQVKKAFNVGS